MKVAKVDSANYQEKVKQIVKWGWEQTHLALWKHPNTKAFGFGQYQASDAYRLHLDFMKRGN